MSRDFVSANVLWPVYSLLDQGTTKDTLLSELNDPLKNTDEQRGTCASGMSAGIGRRGFMVGVAGLAGSAATVSAVAATETTQECDGTTACRTPGCDYDVLVIGVTSHLI